MNRRCKLVQSVQRCADSLSRKQVDRRRRPVRFARLEVLECRHLLTSLDVPPLPSPDGLSENAEFGTSIAVDGDFAVVGAPGDDGTTENSGSAYVYQRTDGVWKNVDKLTANDASGGDAFGQSVAIDDGTIIVGAAFNDYKGVTNSGLAYVFEPAGDKWTQVERLSPQDASPNQLFGASVSLSGNTVVVGAPKSGQNAPGAAYVFDRTAENVTNWRQVQKVVPVGGDAVDRFGNSVSISGDAIVIGSNAIEGAAFVSTRSGADTTPWTNPERLNAGDRHEDGDCFGFSVGVSGDTIVVGACKDSRDAEDSGTAYVYKRKMETGVWELKRALTPSTQQAGAEFGRRVAIDGDSILVGAPFESHASGSTGAAYIFVRTSEGDNNWVEGRKLVFSAASGGKELGRAVAVSGNTALVGARAADSSASGSVVATNVRTGADLTVMVEPSDDAIAGSDLTYAVTVTNAGPADAEQLQAFNAFEGVIDPGGDNIPFGVTVKETSGCQGSEDSSDRSVCMLGSIAAGGIATYTITVSLPPETPAGTKITNNVAVVSSTPDPGPGANFGSGDATVGVRSDLSVTMFGAPNPVRVDESLTYTILVQNHGPSDVIVSEDRGATVMAMFSGLEDVTYISAATGGATGNTAVGSGDINDGRLSMPAGSLIAYTVTGSVATSMQTIENMAEVSSPIEDQNPENDNDTARTTIITPAALQVVFTPLQEAVAGLPLQPPYSFTVRNNGTEEIRGATISHMIPRKLTDVSYTSSVMGGASGNTPMGIGDIADRANIPGQGSITYNVSGRLPSDETGVLEMTARVTSLNVTSTYNASTTITSQSALSIEKPAWPTEVIAGQSFTYSIVVKNDGPSDANDVTVKEVISDQLTIDQITRSPVGGATVTMDGETVIDDMVSLPAHSGIFYTVTTTVRSDATGEITNTTEVSLPNGETEMETTKTMVLDGAAPAAPTALAAVPGDQQVSLDWIDSDPAPDSYNVYRSTTEGNYTEADKVNTEIVASSDYVDMEVENGTTYFYIVRAVANDVESADSNEVTATPNPPGAPEGAGDVPNGAPNIDDPFDTDRDGFVSPIDALLIIYALNHPIEGPINPQWDVNGDDFVSPIDALLVINYLDLDRHADQAVAKQPAAMRLEETNPVADHSRDHYRTTTTVDLFYEAFNADSITDATDPLAIVLFDEPVKWKRKSFLA